MTYTEVVSRTFVSGILEGVTIEQRIPRISKPRAIGTRHLIKSVFGSTYDDTILAVEPDQGR